MPRPCALGVATFSKPSHSLLFPLVVLQADVNGGGGDRPVSQAASSEMRPLPASSTIRNKLLDSHTGFPFANGSALRQHRHRAGDRHVCVDIIAHEPCTAVFLHNRYFAAGRCRSGLCRTLFPGARSILLFLARPRNGGSGNEICRTAWPRRAAAHMLICIPGRADSIGQPLLHELLSAVPFLTPAPVVRAARRCSRQSWVGACSPPRWCSRRSTPPSFRDHVVWTAARAAVETDARQRFLAMVTGEERRARRPVGGVPAAAAYFLDANAFDPEGAAFWVKGRGRARISSCVRRPARALRANRAAAHRLPGRRCPERRRTEHVRIKHRRRPHVLQMEAARPRPAARAWPTAFPTSRRRSPPTGCT